MADETTEEPPSEAGSVPHLGDRERYRQRRRRPKSIEARERPKNTAIEEALDLVPVAGDGYRWYDYPCMVLWWLASGWRAKVIRGRFRKWIFEGINLLGVFNSHDRDKAWAPDDPHHNVIVPEDEHVNVAGIWVVELFPPTELPALERAIQRNGWDRPRITALDEGNQKALEKARAGGGVIWWRLVDVVGKNSAGFVPGGVHSDLPPEFGYVGMRAVQVGASLTAVIAHFQLTADGATALDGEWHRQHEPLLQRHNGRLRALDRRSGTLWEVQSERRRLHYAGRDWLANRLPGFFASSGGPSPLLDLLLFDQLDPSENRANSADDKAADQQKLQNADALRALGLRDPTFDLLLSQDLPKLVLSYLDGRAYEALGDDPTWTLWGSRRAVVEALGPDGLKFYGGNQNRAIAARLVENMYNLFVMLAVSQFLTVTDRRYASIRDRASTRHGKFRPKALADLRRDFLTLSLNLTSVRRDVLAFWERPWRWDGDAEFWRHPSARAEAPRMNQSAAGRQPESFNKSVRESHRRRFARLVEADKDYRDILSTVASLGTSADSYRLGRLALCVAIASMVAAIAAVAGADLGPESLWSYLRQAIPSWFD